MESSGDNNIINEEPKDKINENNKNLQSSQEKHFEATENIGFYSKKSFWNERFQIHILIGMQTGNSLKNILKQF